MKSQWVNKVGLVGCKRSEITLLLAVSDDLSVAARLSGRSKAQMFATKSFFLEPMMKTRQSQVKSEARQDTRSDGHTVVHKLTSAMNKMKWKH